VGVWRLGSRKSGNDRTYFDFRTDFPDGPESSQVDILGSLDEPRSTEASPAQGADDDTPF
jgi:hypothetical protein